MHKDVGKVILDATPLLYQPDRSQTEQLQSESNTARLDWRRISPQGALRYSFLLDVNPQLSHYFYVKLWNCILAGTIAFS